MPSVPLKHVLEPMLMILPEPRATMWGYTALMQSHAPRTLTSKVRSHTTMDTSVNGPRVVSENMAALLISTSMRPNRSMAACAMANVDASLLTSVVTERHSPPEPASSPTTGEPSSTSAMTTRAPSAETP